MKLITIIIISLVSFTSLGQRIDYKFGIYERDSLGRLAYTPAQFTKVTAGDFYKRALILTDIKKEDSLIYAYYMFKDLRSFDSSIYSLNIISPFLRKIETLIANLLKTHLIGYWYKKWEILDVPICGEISKYMGIQKIKITSDSIFLFKKKKLISKYSYTLAQKDIYNNVFFVQNFQLLINNNGTKWNFSISETHPLFPEYNKEFALYLSIETNPGTSFARFQEIYVRDAF